MTQLIVNGQILHETPSLVLFDKDGTLVDIHHYWVSMILHRASLITERLFIENDIKKQVQKALISAMGVDQDTARMKPEGPVGIKPRPYIVDVAVETVKEFGILSDAVSMEAMFKEIDQLTAKDMSPLLKCLPGVVDLLKQLKKHGVPAAIVTTDITERACKAMEALSLSDYFIDIVGGDAVSNTKPSPDLAEYVISTYNCVPEKVVVVGDHPVDIEMGLAAGVRTNIGVLTGLSNSDAFNHLSCVIAEDLTKVQVRK